MLGWKATFRVLLLVATGLATVSTDEEASDMPAQLYDAEPAMNDVPLQHDGEREEEVTPEQLHKLHAKMDADASGKLSLDEIVRFYHETQQSVAAKEAPGIMEEIDGDKDGKVSLDEITRDMHGADEDESSREQTDTREGEKFKVADSDNDGLLDEKELSAFFYHGNHNILQITAEHRMQDQDEDKDGFLTIEELFGKIEGGPEAYGSSLQTFKKLDKDGSGKIDVKELLPYESGHVHILQDIESFMNFADTNGDQHMTIEELHAAHGTPGDEEKRAVQYYFMEMVQHHEL